MLESLFAQLVGWLAGVLTGGLVIVLMTHELNTQVGIIALGLGVVAQWLAGGLALRARAGCVGAGLGLFLSQIIGAVLCACLPIPPYARMLVFQITLMCSLLLLECLACRKSSLTSRAGAPEGVQDDF